MASSWQYPPVILCVDDEESILRSLERCLFPDGYRIVTALGGEEALKQLEQLGGEVDLVIFDQKMPGMMGDEFLRIANKRFGRFTAIMLSGFVDVEGVQRAIKEGHLSTFMAKPWNNQELRKTVRSLLSAGGLIADD